jgi:hypothetical protein
MTTAIVLVLYLIVGIFLHSHSPWGKRYYSERPTSFTLFWIVPAFGTLLFYLALALVIVFRVLSAVGALICVLLNFPELTDDGEDDDWGTVLINQSDKVMKMLILNE